MAAFAVACGKKTVGASVPALARSADGFTWAYATLPVGIPVNTVLTSIACTATNCICVGYNPVGSALVILTSTDGLVWTQQTAPSAFAGVGQPPCVWLDTTRALIGTQDLAFNPVVLVSVDGGMTWSSNSLSGTTASNTIFGISGNSTQYFAVGYGDPADDTALIQTSPDGTTWTPRTPADGLGFLFNDVWATDALTVAVGSDDVASQVIIDTSPTGALWTSESIPSTTIPLSALIGVSKNDTLWAAVGLDQNGLSLILTSPNGLTWSHTDAGVEADSIAICAFNPQPPSQVGNKTAFIYDDSCHLYTTQNQGGTWFESHQSIATLGDDWPDLAMASNDGDYKSMLSTDDDYLQNTGGAIGISLNFGLIGSWSVSNPDPTNNIYGSTTKSIIWSSGAISTAGGVIVLAPSYKNNSGRTQSSLYRSIDGGVTFSTVGPAGWWSAVAFGQNGTIQYASNAFGTGHVYKSIDSGATWNALATSPQNVDGNFVIKSALRLRCTPDGTIIVYALSQTATASGFNEVWVSKDSGATWTKVHTFAVGNTISDAGLSDNGQVMIAISGQPGDIIVSTDTGTTWTPAVGTKAGKTPVACNVSPDGQGFIVGYYLGFDGSVDLSFDQGATWSNSFTGSIFHYDAAYLLPSQTIFNPVTPVPPPTPTPTPTPVLPEQACVATDVIDYIFKFPDQGAWLRDEVIQLYAPNTASISPGVQLLMYNPVETLQAPIALRIYDGNPHLPPTIPPTTLLGNTLVQYPEFADSSVALSGFWAMLSIKGFPPIPALANHPNIQILNDRTQMFRGECSVLFTKIDISHINIVINIYGVYVRDGLCLSECVF